MNSCCAKLECDVGINRACLTISNHNEMGIILHTRNAECLNCPFTHTVHVEPFTNKTILVDTIYTLAMGYSYNDDSMLFCPLTTEFIEATTYLWDINPPNSVEKTANCSYLRIMAPGRNIYMPFVILMAILCVATVIFFVANLFIKKSKKPRLPGEVEVPKPLNNLAEKAAHTFTGLCLVLLMFFNYNELHYSFARHTLWNGLKFPDLIMPWFLWIFGFNICPNISKELQNGVGRSWIFLNICKTSGKLFMVGLMLSSLHHPGNFEMLTFVGPLQQIALIYFIIATIEAIFCVKRNGNVIINNECMVPELASSPFQWVVYVTIMACYMTIYLSARVPGCPWMYFGAGGAENHMKYYNCSGGVSRYIDDFILRKHIAVNEELLQVYGGPPFNKYGILPVISGSLAMFIGNNAGKTYFLNLNRLLITMKMILGTLFGIFLCGILCGFNTNFGVFPLNYNLLSLSLMLLACSFANMIHLALAWSIDWLKLWDGKPLLYLGKNVLLIYVLHIMLNPCFPIFWLTKYDEVLHCHYIVMSSWAIVLFTGLAAYLHEKHIYFSV